MWVCMGQSRYYLFPLLQKALLDSIVLAPLQLNSQKLLEERSNVYIVNEETEAQEIFKLYS